MLCAPLIARVAGEIPRGVYLEARPRVARLVAVDALGIVTEYRTVARATVPAAHLSPSDRILIEGHVQAMQLTLPAGPTTTLPVWDDDAHGASLPLKIRVQRCTWPGWAHVDSDSRISMPGGEDLNVELVAPEGWLDLPGPGPGPAPLPVWAVQARVRACVIECRTPPDGRMTYTFDALAGPPSPTMAVPRRANGFWFYAFAGLSPSIEAVDAGVARSNVQGNPGFSQAKQNLGAWAVIQPQAAYTAGTIVWGID